MASSASPQTQRICRYCDGIGHTKRSCWQRLADEKQKEISDQESSVKKRCGPYYDHGNYYNDQNNSGNTISTEIPEKPLSYCSDSSQETPTISGFLNGIKGGSPSNFLHESQISDRQTSDKATQIDFIPLNDFSYLPSVTIEINGNKHQAYLDYSVYDSSIGTSFEQAFPKFTSDSLDAPKTSVEFALATFNIGQISVKFPLKLIPDIEKNIVLGRAFLNHFDTALNASERTLSSPVFGKIHVHKNH